jgi:hypothetical protein
MRGWGEWRSRGRLTPKAGAFHGRNAVLQRIVIYFTRMG